MKVASLFSGIGGADLGFERAGHEVVFQCELDKHARGILKRHWPTVQTMEDIRDVRGRDLPEFDVLVGGFPCQDLSVAGRRAGLAGERSGLFHEFARIADEAHPEWVVIENVPGLRSSNEGRDLEVVIATLGELGYVGGFATLDAQYAHVPQRRERVFIVGQLGGGIERVAQVLFEPESVCGDSPPSRAKREDVAGTLGGSSQSGGFRTTVLDGHGAYVVAEVANPLTASAGHHGHSSPRGDGGDNLIVVAENQRGEVRMMDISPALGAGGGKPGSGYTAIVIQDGREIEKHQNGLGISTEDLAYTLDGTGAQAVYVPEVAGALTGEMYHHGGVPNQTLSSDGQQLTVGYVPTISVAVTSKWAKGSGGPAGDEHYNLVAPHRVRRLTPLECERVMGFPDGWTDGQADSHRYKQLGNAIVPSVAEWIAARIGKAHLAAGLEAVQ